MKPDNYRDNTSLLICHCALSAAKESLDNKNFQEFKQNFLYKLFDEKEWMTMKNLVKTTAYIEEFE